MYKQLAVAAAFAIASSSVLAQQAPQFYAGADFSSIKSDDVPHENGYGAFGGYRINEHFAVEAGYHRLAKTTTSYDYESDSFSFHSSGHSKLYQADVSLIGTLPLGKGISAYARLGVDHLKSKGSGTVTINGVTTDITGSVSATRGLYGIGLSYAFSPTIAARIEVQKPHSEIVRTAAGVAYSF
ncbi:outer membrane beta-barrel protein [Massilia sp. Dwa41.01b]|uniref:outer membrane beta-barrel protein n=1 Tax=unclassified Massilia TaxID=2609279 RepID=UPI0016022460|nr:MULTISPECIES: outer membrane beta-barrel protein [unclassified Massilia]QNA89151.1 outer membrane beta-barrel protein [Massilia sp. Dwa41.01b]QNB00044.1 outer membrane beta-barrel protein [Massilia sp. Se16.2.3]